MIIGQQDRQKIATSLISGIQNEGVLSTKEKDWDPKRPPRTKQQGQLSITTARVLI